MSTHNTTGKVLLTCTDHPSDDELRRRHDIARTFATKAMRGTLSFHGVGSAVWVDDVDHRDYLIELVGFSLVVSNQNFDTTFTRTVLVPTRVPIGAEMVAQLFAVRRMVIGADIVQEIGAMEFDDRGLFRSCHTTRGGHPLISVHAGHFGWVDVEMNPRGPKLRTIPQGRPVWRKRTGMRAIAKRLGAETPEQGLLLLEGVAHQVLLRSLDEPRFSAINPAPAS